jgi:hypothetical protein
MSLATKFKSVAAAFRQSSITLGRDIDGLREQLDKLKSERDRVAALPITKVMAIERLDEWVGDLRRNPRAGIEGLVLSMMAPQKKGWIDFLSGSLDGYYNAKIEWALADHIREKLAAKIEAAYAGGVTGIEDAERERQLAKIDADIADCEAAEESMIRAAQDAGITIVRRPDASPHAVLARDADLPAA